MNDRIYQALSQASADIMMNKVEHLILSWTTSDGEVHTLYDKKDDASFVEMLGGLTVLQARVLHGYANIPELFDEEGDDD